MVSKGVKTCIGIFLFIGFIIAAGLVGGSFKSVAPLEYGLLQNTISKELNTKRVYSSGRYFIGPSYKFITYPRQATTIVLGVGGDSGSVVLPSSQVTMECSLQYQLIPTGLATLYSAFGTAYTSRFIGFASNALFNGLSSFTAQDFYQNRAQVEKAGFAALQAAFLNNSATILNFQLRTVKLPVSTESSILTTLLAQQTTQTATNIQKQQEILARQNVIVGDIQNQLNVFLATLKTTATVIEQTANAEAKQTSLLAKGRADAALLAKLNITADDLLKYNYYKQLQSVPSNAKIAAGFTALSGM